MMSLPCFVCVLECLQVLLCVDATRGYADDVTVLLVELLPHTVAELNPEGVVELDGERVVCSFLFLRHNRVAAGKTIANAKIHD
jgi:hypothetical protein